MPDNTDGSIVALIPKADDPIVAASSEPAHITLAWLGPAADLSEEDVAALRNEVRDYFAQVDDLIIANAVGRETLGDDEADVVMVDGDGLRALRDGLVALPKVAEVMSRVEQYPEWTPHVTLGYPDSPANDPDYSGETVEFDAASLWIGSDREDMAFEIDKETPMDEEEVEPTDEEMQDEFADGEPVPWHGVLAPIGVESGDGRKFAQMLTTRDLPIPLKFMKEDGQGHDRSIVVANITAVWEDNGLIKAEGFFANTEEAAEVIALRAEDMVRGVSVDLDMVEAEFQRVDGSVLAEGDPIPPDTEPVTMVVTKGRIAAATIVAIPAFQEAWFDLGTWDDEQIMQEDAEEPGITAASGWAAPADAEFAPGTKDGPGWITNPKATSRIRRYWTHGKGAAKIKWGAPGDFNRCRTQLAKYIQNPAFLAGTCANMHKEALGFWPGEHHGGETMTASAAPAFTLVDPPEAVTAGGFVPPAAWFQDPALEGPTPMTVTEDGMVYGHAATWSECHIGIQNKCVTAPHSLTGYAYFHTGAVATDEGDVAVGHITMSTGHATLDLAAGPAAEHYDNTGTVVADIRVGEDKFGIWVAGALRPGLTDDQKYALKAAAISGDWRPIGAGLEMVAALAVNTPGFPIPRTALAASGETLTALVAAAVVEPVAMPEEFDLSKVVASGIEEYEARKERKVMRESLSSSIKNLTTEEDRERAALRESILSNTGE